MKNLVILIKMQLKEMLNFKRLEVENVNKFHVVLSIIVTVLKFALVTVLCGVFLKVSSFLHLFSIGNRIPTSVISLVFTVMLIASIVSCVVGLTKSMYYSRDNAVLLTLPVMPMQVYLSKLFIFFIYELKRNLSFIVPLFIAYFITEGTYSFGAYPWMLFCIFWLCLFTVAVGALLSIPAMWVANFFRQRKWLQITLLAVAMTAVITAFIWIVTALPSELDLVSSWTVTRNYIQNFFESYKLNFKFFYDISSIILGIPLIFGTPSFPFFTIFGRFSILFGLTVVFLGAGLLIVQPLFYKMASTPFEYLKKQTPPKRNRVLTRRVTAVYAEFLKTVKTSDRIAASVGITLIVPLLAMLLNKILFALNINSLGYSMTVAFNVLIILLVVLNSNTYPASVFSRDGRSSYLIKTQPSKYPLLILSKLLPSATFGALSIFVSLFILLGFAKMPTLDIVLLVLSIGMTYIAHMLYCAELDLMNPQIELYATVGSNDNNPNETKATLTAFLVSFIAAAAVFLLSIEASAINVFLKFAFVAACALVYRVYIFFAKLKLYYKEK